MLNHRESGKGHPLVLLHAFPLSNQMWESELTFFSKNLRVMAPDLPGFGKSVRQKIPSIPQMAVEIASWLESLRVKEPVIVAGLSMGGYVAFEFIRQFPERVRAVGLFSTRAGVDTPAAKEGRFKTAQEIQEKGLNGLARAILPKLLGETTRSTQPAVAQTVEELILSNSPEGVADSLIAMAHRRDSTELLGQFSWPTLVLAGEEDSFIPVSETRTLAEQIPQAQLGVIPQAGHLVNLEQNAAFQRAWAGFLEEIASIPR